MKYSGTGLLLELTMIATPIATLAAALVEGVRETPIASVERRVTHDWRQRRVGCVGHIALWHVLHDGVCGARNGDADTREQKQDDAAFHD